MPAPKILIHVTFWIAMGLLVSMVFEWAKKKWTNKKGKKVVAMPQAKSRYSSEQIKKMLETNKGIAQGAVEFIKELIEDHATNNKFAGAYEVSAHDNWLTVWDGDMEAIYEVQIYPIKNMDQDELDELRGENSMSFDEYERNHGSLRHCERNPDLR